RTEVTFGEMTEKEIEEYIATKEPMDKAGAYAIQGKAARFIKCINGSFSNVVGLPLHELNELLKEAKLKNRV
ncbi:MAG: Maf family protein, partial [Selenomonadaceae bacterium]|nr:Maf family protein [Selenomonadaceae bacterium]